MYRNETNIIYQHNYDTLTNNDTTLHYTTLNQRYEYEQCYHPTEREIKKSRYFLAYPQIFRQVDSQFFWDPIGSCGIFSEQNRSRPAYFSSWIPPYR